jgi:hypothetical protein
VESGCGCNPDATEEGVTVAISGICVVALITKAPLRRHQTWQNG